MRMATRAPQRDGHTQGAAGTSHRFCPLPMGVQRCRSSGADRLFFLLVWNFGESVQRLGYLVMGWVVLSSQNDSPSLSVIFFLQIPPSPCPDVKCGFYFIFLVVNCLPFQWGEAQLKRSCLHPSRTALSSAPKATLCIMVSPRLLLSLLLKKTGLIHNHCTWVENLPYHCRARNRKGYSRCNCCDS